MVRTRRRMGPKCRLSFVHLAQESCAVPASAFRRLDERKELPVRAQHVSRDHVVGQELEDLADTQGPTMKAVGHFGGPFDQGAMDGGVALRAGKARGVDDGFLVLEMPDHMGDQGFDQRGHFIGGPS